MNNTRINISYLTLRRNLGILGIGLPIFLFIGNCFSFMPSISEFYYTRMSVVFSGSLITFGVFLFSYRGYVPKDELISDNWITNFAGVAIILTALIPTSSDLCYAGFVPNGYGKDILKHSVHLASACIFFLLMGWMAWEKFTKKEENFTSLPWKEQRLKYKRNKIYRICAIGIWASIGLIAAEMILRLIFKECGCKFNLTGIDTYVLEAFALWFFGTAWLVKSKALERYGV